MTPDRPPARPAPRRRSLPRPPRPRRRPGAAARRAGALRPAGDQPLHRRRLDPRRAPDRGLSLRSLGAPHSLRPAALPPPRRERPALSVDGTGPRAGRGAHLRRRPLRARLVRRPPRRPRRRRLGRLAPRLHPLALGLLHRLDLLRRRGLGGPLRHGVHDHLPRPDAGLRRLVVAGAQARPYRPHPPHHLDRRHDLLALRQVGRARRHRHHRRGRRGHPLHRAPAPVADPELRDDHRRRPRGRTPSSPSGPPRGSRSSPSCSAPARSTRTNAITASSPPSPSRPSSSSRRCSRSASSPSSRSPAARRRPSPASPPRACGSTTASAPAGRRFSSSRPPPPSACRGSSR